MKLIKLIIITLLLASCGSTGKNNPISGAEKTSTEETKEVTTPEKSHAIIGNWRADAKDAGIEITISFDQSGTFTQNMGEQKQEGTWEIINENQIKIDTENLKNGQIWELSNVNSDKIKVAFSIKDGFSKAILFKAI